MNIEAMIQKIQALFHHPDGKIPDEIIQSLIQSLDDEQREPDCSCDDVFSVVDQYAEMEIQGQDAERLMPLLRKHLDHCHDCCEEYEALLDILQKSNENP